MAPIYYKATISLLLLVSMLPLCTGFWTTLALERVVPHGPVNVTEQIALDRARHVEMMWPSGGATNFPVGITRTNPTAIGIYYIRLRLGTPLKEFNVIPDTGSEISWVTCTPRMNRVQNITYNPRNSSSSSFVTCDKRCKSKRGISFCSADDELCHFSIQYLDESISAGFYVKDLLNYESISGNQTFRSATPIMFGCTTATPNLMQKTPLDGIFGLGRQSVSFFSQLFSQGLAPPVFSHCLSGNENNGGSLIFGEAVAPNMVYSPMIEEPHYTLRVEFVSVNGHKLNIDPSVFSATLNKGATIDSGTTYAYLPPIAYNSFVAAIDAAVSSYAQVVAFMDYHCYRITAASAATVFPQISFKFEGGAALIIGPLDYLQQLGPMGGANMWCLVFFKHDGVTVLGDIVLRNKIIVYDLAGQRIGWANYNCSKPLNVSTEVKRRGNDAASSRPNLVYMLFSIIIVFLLVSKYPI